ncbi:hypothetical protein N7466_009472 [Penicillium verhagenii]|uniref:uncharacterized protein n=1 Tax=Penicillium verhagenii TaxID=1562060 RepID=UPI00254567B9|nr:uncharacterized protein N7466_009472 [Penicillium verhagenii]KAJ5921146.1 hypothetical protein N7466_009472 [Penicillium verhagenii]
MSANDYTTFPPGTHLLEDDHSNVNEKKELILKPTPSADPEDPLNWSTPRKALNFGLTCSYVVFTFVLIDVGSTLVKYYEKDLHLYTKAQNKSSGASYAGLAIGALIFIPCVHKFGRRPIYIISAILQFVAAIWDAKFTSEGEYITIGLLSGLSGSTCEAIVMITIVDLFFLHQHARMNGVFILMQTLGTLGGPIAAGYVAVYVGWRWVWWITAILLGTNLLLVLFFFEESKYVPRSGSVGKKISKENHRGDADGALSSSDSGEISSEPHMESQTYYPRKTYLQRLALVTKTDGPMLRNFYRPLIAPFFFPAVAFTAFQYGIIQSWFSATVTAGTQNLFYAPYNFQPNQIGLFNIGGFIGVVLAGITIALVSDRLVVVQARRNKGVFEPEMRLWLLFPAIICNSIGSWVFGIGLARGWHWIILAAGNAIFGFGFMITADVALTYLTDTYPLIINDALISVVFIRNGLGMIIKFALNSWLTGMGLQNAFILIGCLSLATMIMPALLIVYGKRARRHSAPKYREFAAEQQSQRAGA